MKNWQTMLEYALPDKLTEEEKQVIRNNVENLLARQKEEIIEKVEKIVKDIKLK